MRTSRIGLTGRTFNKVWTNGGKTPRLFQILICFFWPFSQKRPNETIIFSPSKIFVNSHLQLDSDTCSANELVLSVVCYGVFLLFLVWGTLCTIYQKVGNSIKHIRQQLNLHSQQKTSWNFQKVGMHLRRTYCL